METVSHGDVLLDKFRVERVLGRGGMGVVVAARHLELDEIFAVKLLNPRPDHDAHSLASRFVHEARAAARLRSPHVVRVFDVGTLADSRPYMVMEYLEGQDLRQLLMTHHVLPVHHVAHLLLQVCDGLAEAHAHQIIHRDLKLDNLFLTRQRDGQPCIKILDFGISKHGEIPDQLTQSGVIMGTPSYMAPEQLRNPKGVDPRADIWAMGVVGYELCTGRKPFGASSLVDLISEVLVATPRSPIELQPTLPADFSELIMSCLVKNHEQRLANVAQLAAGLARHAGAGDGWATLFRDRGSTMALELGPNDPASQLEATQSYASVRATNPKVFLSYRVDVPTDAEAAAMVHQQLSALDVQVFPPIDQLGLGASRLERAEQALDLCDLFILLLSEHSTASEVVAAELDMARQRNARCGQPRLLALRLDATSEETLSSSYASIMPMVDWRGPTDTRDALGLILQTLGFAGMAGLSELPTVAEPTSGPASSPASRPAPGPPKRVELEFPGDVVHAASRYYVEHPELERRCIRELDQPGGLVRIKGPRRMGKGSLLLRTLEHTRARGMRVVLVDLHLLDDNIASNLDRLLLWLCAIVSRRLKLPRIAPDWDDVFGPKDNCTAFFEEHLLIANSPLVVAIKNLDRLFDNPGIAENFLTMLRAWHELAKSDPLWSTLRLVLVYSTEIYLPLDINHSPLNVGVPIVISEWSQSTILELAGRHGLDWTLRDVDALMAQIGGHPHLVRIALYTIADRGLSLEEAMASCAEESGMFGDHIKHLLWLLAKQPRLAAGATAVMESTTPISLESDVGFKLVSLGLIRHADAGFVIGCQLYRRILSARTNARVPS